VPEATHPLFRALAELEESMLERMKMTTRKVVLSAFVTGTLLCGAILLAQKPERNISARRHSGGERVRWERACKSGRGAKILRPSLREDIGSSPK